MCTVMSTTKEISRKRQDSSCLWLTFWIRFFTRNIPRTSHLVLFIYSNVFHITSTAQQKKYPYRNIRKISQLTHVKTAYYAEHTTPQQRYLRWCSAALDNIGWTIQNLRKLDANAFERNEYKTILFAHDAKRRGVICITGFKRKRK